jgi:hypothetical protein
VADIVLKDLNVKADKKKLIKKLCIKKEDENELSNMLKDAKEIAKPKALFAQFNIQARADDYVIIEDIKFCSRVLAVNFKDVYKVFPYLATAGIEIEKWSEQFDDILIRYWADIIKEEILSNALKELFQKIDKDNNLVKAAQMNPGFLEDCPIDEQQQLFALLGDKASKIGISLTDTMLMYPTKSVSGIRFPTEVDYENCQLCKRENCLGRRAAYQPELYKKKYEFPL